MSLRIQAARWFELLLPRPQLAQALDLLAQSKAVELEGHQEKGWSPVDGEALRPMLLDARQLRQRFAPFWPSATGIEPVPSKPAEVRLAQAVAHLQSWRQAAELHVAAVERLQGKRCELAQIADFLQRSGEDQSLDFGSLAHPLEKLSAALFLLPAEAPLLQGIAPLLVKRVAAANHVYALVLGPAPAVAELTHALGGRDARSLMIPDFLAGNASQALVQVRDRIGELEHQIDRQRAQIDALNREHEIAPALGEIDRLQWLAGHLATLAASEHLARVTGWTLLRTPAELVAPLQRVGLAALAGFPPMPAGYQPPTMSENPRWARPFELFLKLAGAPARDEADPSILVAFIAPLMFGYMFGDLGQGLVLFLSGLMLRRRWPATGMLVPGGLVAMAFGVLFGSVFASSGVLSPLWTDPIHDPLPVLAVPLLGGASLILLGLGLNALSAAWSGRFYQWLKEEVGVVLIYLAAAALILLHARTAIWIALLGAFWFVFAPLPGGGWEHLIGRIGELLERLLQLAVNTLSFVRVGAFALAHAGLSLALAALASATHSKVGVLAVFVAGNLLILALEGMVVGIQTTRLVLFEFFIRFVRGEGRVFRPLQLSGPV